MSALFAILSRMRHITRWGLMRNAVREDIQQHSHQAATIAHCLAVIRNRVYGGSVSPERVALLALYHDAGEVITGDLPTPVKNHSPELHGAYKRLERLAEERLVELTPEPLRPDFAPLFLADRPEDREALELVKAADRLCAYLKCLEERRAGNQEFEMAEEASLRALREHALPETEWFLKRFGPAFHLTIDELNA